MIYIFGYMLTNFLMYLVSKMKTIKSNTFVKVLLSSLPFVLISSLRYGIGTDYHNYVDIFDLYVSNGIQGKIEPLFYSMMRIIALYDLNIQWIFAIPSAIYVTCIFSQIYKESPNIYISLFLFFFLTYYLASFNIMRQCVAVSICFFSIRFINNNSFKKFLLSCIVAFGFHYTSVVFVIAYWLKRITLSPKVAFSLIGLFVLFSKHIGLIINMVMNDTLYHAYFETPNGGISNALIIGILIQLAILSLSSIYYIKSEIFQLYYNFQVIATITTILSYVFPYASRIKLYYSLPSIILIPMVLRNMSNGNRIIFSFVIAVMTILYYITLIYILGSYEVVPFNSVFTQ